MTNKCSNPGQLGLPQRRLTTSHRNVKLSTIVCLGQSHKIFVSDVTWSRCGNGFFFFSFKKFIFLTEQLLWEAEIKCSHIFAFGLCVSMKVYRTNSWWCESLMSYDELNFSCSCPALLEVVGKDLGQTLRCIKMNFPAISIKTSAFYQNHNGNNSLGSTAVIVEESRLILSNPIQKSGYHRQEEGRQCSKVRKLVNVFLNCWWPSQLLQPRSTSMEIQLTSLLIRLLSLCQTRLLLWAF